MQFTISGCASMAEAGAAGGDESGSRLDTEKVLDRFLVEGLSSRADEGDGGLIAPFGVRTGERDVTGPPVAVGRGAEGRVGWHALRGQLILDQGLRRQVDD